MNVDRRSRRFGSFNCFVAIGLVFAARLAAQSDADWHDAVIRAPESAEPASARAVPRPHPLPPRTVFRQVVVGGNGVAGEPVAERLVYSNTHGRFAIAPGAQIRIADDITTTAPSSCPLTRFAFEVTGKVDPGRTGGPYSVSWRIHTVCPGALPSIVEPMPPGPIGTIGSVNFPDDAPARVEVLLNGMTLPTNFWLAVTFSRDNAGIVMGAPAFTGFTQDAFDYPGAACIANFGGFPEQPHGSFNLQVWAPADNDACREIHVAYLARNEAGPGYYPGAATPIVDDLNLVTPNCQLVGYEVTVGGPARYDFAFRNSCEGAAIPGTFKFAIVSSGMGSEPRNLRFVVDPPVLLPQDLWFAAGTSNSTARIVVAGIEPAIGSSEDVLAVQHDPDAPEPPDCEIADRVPNAEDALNLTIFCDGPAPVGACCDMYVTECVEGPSAGRPCGANDDCVAPGHCEVVCRELPLVNCPFPRPGSELRPTWQEGDACSPNPFPEGTCGTSACCYVNPQDQSVCENLTENQCAARQPSDDLRDW